MKEERCNSHKGPDMRCGRRILVSPPLQLNLTKGIQWVNYGNSEMLGMHSAMVGEQQYRHMSDGLSNVKGGRWTYWGNGNEPSNQEYIFDRPLSSSVGNSSKPLERFRARVGTGTEPLQWVLPHEKPGPLLLGRFPPENLALASPAFLLQLGI